MNPPAKHGRIQFQHVHAEYLDGPFPGLAQERARSSPEKLYIAMRLVQREPLLLASLPPRWRCNKCVVAEAVWKSPQSLRYACKKLQESRGLQALARHHKKNGFSKAVQRIMKDPFHLQHLKPRWQNNKAVVALAIIRQGRALEFASDRLKRDRALTLLALSGGLPFLSLPGIFANDRLLALIAVRNNGALIQSLSEQLRADPEIVAIASLTFNAMPFTTPMLQTNKSFLLSVAARCEPGLIGPLVDPFVHDADFVAELLKITAPKLILLLKVSNLSGKTVLTSIKADSSTLRRDAEREGLGLDRLFEATPVSGSFLFEGELFHFSDWVLWVFTFISPLTYSKPCQKLRIDTVHDVQVILHD